MIYDPQVYAIEDKANAVPFISEKEIEGMLDDAKPTRKILAEIISNP